ncbi:MAG TPA: tetratricopeptide repeat protein [Pirellulales bacterium]|nr:tetratricopeptide repeat protein [Pirellulales bacterium]
MRRAIAVTVWLVVIALARGARADEPRSIDQRLADGRLAAAQGRHAEAVADYSRVLELDPKLAGAWQARGVEYFKLGQIDASIADFDRFLELMPEKAPQHWQRGIALYYAGRYADGRKQFELHQTVNPDDVENAAWHFLCTAREMGVDEARKRLIPVGPDRRVPMAEIYELFAGRATADDVLAAAERGPASDAQRQEQRFYAHLYLGLYDEAMGDTAGAREQIALAAEKFPSDHYMGDVARVHAARLRASH